MFPTPATIIPWQHHDRSWISHGDFVLDNSKKMIMIEMLSDAPKLVKNSVLDELLISSLQ